MIWFLTALISPLIWAITNVADKALRTHWIKNDLAISWIAIITQIPVGILLVSLTGGIDSGNAIALFWMLFAGILWGITSIFWYKAVSEEEASRVIIMLQMVPVFTLLIAYFAIDERLESAQFLAFLLLLCGGVVASLKRSSTKKFRMSKAFWVMAIACFLWASTDVIFKKFEPSFGNFLNAFAWFIFGRPLPAIFILVSKTMRKKIFNITKTIPRKIWLAVGFNSFLMTFGSILFSYALTLGAASLTTVFVGIQPLFVLLIVVLLSPHFRFIERESLTGENIALKGIAFLLIMSGMIFLNSNLI